MILKPDLIEKIVADFSPCCEQEECDRQIFLSLIRDNENILTRENGLYHFTSSAWTVNRERNRVLMVFHRIYQAWSWPGGHADGDADLSGVACRELEEETGLTNAELLLPMPISLELIGVQAHEKHGVYVAPHLHLNVSYFFEADDSLALRIKADENTGVAWRTVTEVKNDATERHMQKIYQKILAKTDSLK